ncbi:general secretion pathway protein H [Bordetella ansorpii]|uniref:General secretion pathway protein H n=2 Tax=Bordetella ansorpii TaxID=288768 RepID=A0A157SRR7_9BORD|nr:general secretion pathway protein H [Bordetella ansorpii]
MVVLVIVGVATASVAMRIPSDSGRALRQDAQRLASQFITAQNLVRIDGRVIAWQADEQGYRFVRGVWVDVGGVPQVSTAAGLDDFARDETLRPRRWESGEIVVKPAGPIVLTDEWFQEAWDLTLSSGSAHVVLRRTPGGTYTVQ